MMKDRLFDLEKHYAFYGAYHRNPINILIHTIFVWPILYTALLLLHFTPFHLSFLLAVIYAVFYILMDKRAGSLAALLTMASWLGTTWVANILGFSLAWKVVLAAQVVCWTGQFLGHGLFEKRAPALLDDPAQAFLMAPLFVLLEVLQNVIGYEPYPGFNQSVKKKIDDEVKQWEDKKMS